MVVILIGLLQQPIYGQALGFVESNSILVGNKRLSLTIDMKPAFLDGETEGTSVIRLREIANDRTIPHVTFNIKLMRASELLFDEYFHSHDGMLSIRFEHVDNDRTQVIGSRESIYNAIVADSSSPIVRGRVLGGGLYHYSVTVLSMEQYENRLVQPLRFDLYTSIGKTFNYQVFDSEQSARTLFIKTYYDQINDLQYSSSERKVAFTMPLNWNVNFLSQVPLIHEEVLIPLDFAELMSNSYTGTLNGVELSSREVIIDDYSYENIRTVHFVVPKDRLIAISQRLGPGAERNVATFTLAPSDVQKFPLEILSGREKFLLQISWSPPTIEPDRPTKFIVTIRDPNTLDTLQHARADFVLLKDGKEIFRKHHAAPIGAIVQDYTFSKDQTGTIMLNIQNINNSGDSAPLLLSVVPEFPAGVYAVSAVLIILAIAFARTRSVFDLKNGIK
ncbi:MAG: hypothetical protein QXN83_00975 [Nitrososphaerales archaeon]